MTDIIIQGIYGRMGRALVEKIGAREDCRIVAGVDREAGRIGEIPVYAGFDALPCKGVIIDFSSPAGAVTPLVRIKPPASYMACLWLLMKWELCVSRLRFPEFPPY